MAFQGKESNPSERAALPPGGSCGTRAVKCVLWAVVATGVALILLYVGLPLMYVLVSANVHTATRRVKTDEELLALAGNKHVWSLMAHSSDVTDRGAAAVAEMPNVRLVEFGQTSITDAAMPLLLRNGKVELLDIEGCAVTDRGAAALRGQARLFSLRLSATRVTDKSLSVVGSLKHLDLLSLDDTRISDGGIRSLSALKDLTLLSLQRTPITDAALPYLATMRIRHLELRGTGVSDAGLDVLANFAGLVGLDVRDTEVSEEGVARFKARRPSVGVHANPVW